MPARRLLLTGAFLTTANVAFGQAPPPAQVPDGTVTVTPPPAAGEVPPPAPVTEPVQPPVELAPEPAPAPSPTTAEPTAAREEAEPGETSPEGETSKPKGRIEIYGFAMTDVGYDFKQVDPDWFDVLRPTKLPAFADEFGEDGNFWGSVRQSRLGVKGFLDTPLGELKTQLEFEFFGVGVDAGQTTIRLRHAYGEIGQFGAGQYWSPFMDIDVFPNSIEYWGPPGMAFYRNVQVRWMPLQGDSRVTVAIERPGASADLGDYQERIELQGINARFPLPDFSAEARYGGDFGYIEGAGILRRIEWDDSDPTDEDLSGGVWGWGLSLSSNLKFMEKNVLKAQIVYGHAIENYMNDAPADIGVHVEDNGDLEGEALPILGWTAFVDLYWSAFASSTFGYSRVDIWDTNGQSPSAFQHGQYALGNILFYPTDNVMLGPEFQFGRRENRADGFAVNDFRIQVSFKFNFSGTTSWTPAE
jgi:hypothetical protein